ncbi:hypothetical protein [Streptomyces guryensis]|uniref:Uncharacterized protein n=1 Tax=Streptomyces guryensis TaxID=2886947 RepID=A0A9Q3VZJ7_9ACTN|nr:hypothetical protein [Streptomyces guryensis]MCD9880508.1 hypothetical protein [Streptomyces guryensis]
MNTRGRTLRYAAVTGFVILSLTGFSGRHHGIGKHHHGSGGCSSSSQDHDTSSHTTTTTTGGSGSYSSPTAATASPAMAVLLTCATVKQPYATVEVSNPNDTAGTFEVTVTFRDAENGIVATRVDRADVPAKGTATVRVNVGGSSALVARVEHCEVADQAPTAT